MQGVLGSQVLFLFVVGSSALAVGSWSSVPAGDDSDALRRLLYYSTTPRRLETTYELRRPWEEQASAEDQSPIAQFYDELDKRSAGKQYNFGLGKRSKTYGFGLGKRLEDAWKNSAASTAYNKQERRSKMYSFGLGKRGGEEFEIEESEAPQMKKSKQFSFGLGKRETEPWTPPQTPP